jgi:hypothetical protein
MSCCTPTGYRTIFGTKAGERDARRYRRKGLVGSARWLLGRLAGDGVAGCSVLEVGGGIGDLQIELVKAGASLATNVEIIDTYEQTAQGLIAETGLGQRVVRHVGDFALRAHDAPTADIVVLHRVICCYPDPDALVAAACDRSRDRIAITIPRESWWVRAGFAGMNAWLRLRRIAFRGFVHPVAGMLEVADSRGFRPVHRETRGIWESIILSSEAARP